MTTGLLVAPAAVHRLTRSDAVSRRRRCGWAGLVALALTLTAAVLLVLDVALDSGQPSRWRRPSW